MSVRSSLRPLARPLLVASVGLGLVFGITHCDSDENVPIDSAFGAGNGQGGGQRDATANTSGGGYNDNPNGDPDFDPTADGGYWSDYDAGEDGYDDAGVNGGPDVYGTMAHCPLIKAGRFSLDVKDDKATIYGADTTPAVAGTVNRINYLTATNVPISFLGPFFPLGFRDPPRLLTPGVTIPRVETFPFFDCKRCLYMATGDTDKIFMAIGGMLVTSPIPAPKSGRIQARADFVVLVESSKSGNKYRPIPGGRCIRLLTVPISVR